LSTRPGQPNADAPPAVGLGDVVGFVWRGARFAVFVAVLAGATAFLLSRAAQPVYRATASLLASAPGTSYGNLGLVTPPQVDPGVYQTALLEGPVARDALTRLHGVAPRQDELERFLRTVHVSLQRQDVSSVVRVSVDAPTAAAAAATANALADGLVAWDRDRARQLLTRSVSALESAVDDLDAQLAAPGITAERRQTLQVLRDQRGHQLEAALARSEASVVVGLLEPLSAATPPAKPFAPRVLVKTAIAILLGLLLGYGLLLLRRAIDPSVRSRAELAALTGVPVLAEFPGPNRKDQRIASEAAGFLMTGVSRAGSNGGPLVIAVTSAHTPHEKQGVALGLARSLARSEGRTLLVDADLRRPSATYGLDVSAVRTPPLEVYLENPEQTYAPATINIGRKRTLDFAPSFTAAAHPVELLQRGFPRLLAAWRQQYDVIVIDCPPLLPFADALAVVPYVGGVVLCAALHGSRRRDVTEGVALLGQQGVHVLGAVLTHIPTSRRLRSATRVTGAEVTAPETADPYGTLSPERGMGNVSVRRR